MKHLWAEVAAQTGRHLDASALDGLQAYRDWLAGEAIPAGGLGPVEATRLDDRHIADSLLFALGFSDNPGRILDVGSGVGLPGIPLAIMIPDTRLLLLDRSGRRVDLMRRAVRILGLDNVEVVQGDVSDHREPEEVIVSRATLPPERALQVLSPLLGSNGVMVLGGSWTTHPRHEGWDTLEAKILDRTIWLLIMRRS